MSTWVCMQACMGIHIKRGIIVSPTSVKWRIWTLNEYDDYDDDDNNGLLLLTQSLSCHLVMVKIIINVVRYNTIKGLC